MKINNNEEKTPLATHYLNLAQNELRKAQEHKIDDYALFEMMAKILALFSHQMNRESHESSMRLVDINNKLSKEVEGTYRQGAFAVVTVLIPTALSLVSAAGSLTPLFANQLTALFTAEKIKTFTDTATGFNTAAGAFNGIGSWSDGRRTAKRVGLENEQGNVKNQDRMCQESTSNAQRKTESFNNLATEAARMRGDTIQSMSR